MTSLLLRLVGVIDPKVTSFEQKSAVFHWWAWLHYIKPQIHACLLRPVGLHNSWSYQVVLNTRNYKAWAGPISARLWSILLLRQSRESITAACVHYIKKRRTAPQDGAVDRAARCSICSCHSSVQTDLLHTYLYTLGHYYALDISNRN